MKAGPVWVHVVLSGMRWGVVCGVATGWMIAATVVLDLGFPGIIGAIVGLLLVGAVYGTIPGAIFGAAIGLIVGLVAGLVLQLALRIVRPDRAVVMSFVSGVGIQVVPIVVLIGLEPWSALYLVIPGIAAVPLLRTLRRVAKETAEPPVPAQRRDTLAA